MGNAPAGYIDMRSAEELLAFFRANNSGLEIPNQKFEKGDPPQPGVPCPKCTYRHFSESYETTTPLGTHIIGSKETCDLLIQRLGKKLHKIDPSILNTLIHQNGYEEEHVSHVASVHTPGTITFMAFSGPDGGASVLCYLVDGTHRAVAALRADRDFYAYVLVPSETIQCLSHMDGRPNPHFVGKQGSVLFDGKGATIILPPQTT